MQTGKLTGKSEFFANNQTPVANLSSHLARYVMIAGQYRRRRSLKKEPVNEPVNEPNTESQLQRLEMKVNALIALCVVQTALLAVLLFTQMFLPSTFTVLVIVVILGGVGYRFRQHLPSISGKIMGSIFQMMARQSSNQSNDMKFK